MNYFVHSFLSVWVEPLQANADKLLGIHQEALVAGDVTYAIMAAFNYCRKSFHCGNNLTVLEKDSVAVAFKMVRK